MLKERDYSIDIIKFIAVFLIINSHADMAYPHFKILATGGAIGDELFLFASGYTIFLGQMRDFGNYYKRRINRIYPSSVACLIVMMALPWWGNDLGRNFYLSFGRPFLVAIMIYYIILWLIRKYLYNRIPWVVAFLTLITLIVYIFFFPYKYETGIKGIFGTNTHFRWLPNFFFPLLGAYLGVHHKELKYSPKSDSIKFFICLVCYYGIQFAAKKIPAVGPYQIIMIVFLAGIVFYLYKLLHAPVFQRIYHHKWGNAIIMIIGGLCLETYLTQYCMITDKLNCIFPLNLIIITIGVLVLAYITRCIARLFSQTFRTEDYEWKKIFSLR